MLPTDSLVEALGGRKVFKRRIVNLDELREAVKAGLPYASLEALIGKTWTQPRRGGGCVALAATNDRSPQERTAAPGR